MSQTLLFVDDEFLNLMGFKAAFRLSYRVLIAKNSEEALSVLSNDHVDIIITDHKMTGRTGVELLRIVKEQFPSIKRFLMTGYLNENEVEKALDDGTIEEYFTKPIDNNSIEKKIDEYNS